MKLKFIVPLLIMASLRVIAQTPSQDNQKSETYRVSDIAGEPTIDGLLAEDSWAHADSIINFKRIYNSDNEPVQSKTIVKILKNNRSLIIAAKLYTKDGMVLKPIVSSLKRDFPFFENDLLGILINPSGDKLNGFAFNVNPFGVLNESQISRGEDFDSRWDQKWVAATKRYENYWTTEIEIPFSSIRFESNMKNWNINFIRIDNSINEYSSWATTPRNLGIGNLAFTNILTFDTAPTESGSKISLIPGLVTSYKNIPSLNTFNSYNFNPSLDAKIKLNAAINADLTINADFSQAEVDASIANLTRFELKFQEKRQFFIENSDLFSGFGYGGYGGSPIRPFYSRRIGITYNEQTESYEQQKIIVGARAYGKLTPSLQFGVLSVQTDATSKPDQQNISQKLPSENFTVMALQQSVWGRSSVGAMVVNQQTFEKGKNAYDRSYSFDFNLGSKNGQWNGKLFHSGNFAESGNVKRRLSGASTAGGGNVWYTTKNYLIALGSVYSGSAFNPKAGFTPRQGFISQYAEADFFFYPKRKESEINRYFIGNYYERFNTLSMSKTDELISVNAGINFKNGSEFGVGANRSYTKLFDAFDPSLSGGLSLNEGEKFNYFNFKFFYNTDRRKIFFHRGSLNLGEYFNGRKYSLEGELAFKIQPYGIFSATYNFNRVALPRPYGSNTIFVFGPKAESAITKSIFISALAQYNSLIKSVAFNYKLQWRFKPLSDIYLVYSDDYTTPLIKNKNKSLVFKMNYWLNL